MAAVFVCYRREDTAPYAGWLRQSLIEALGKTSVFMDIDTIAPGSDFDEVIHHTLDKTDVMVVLIGPKWATLQDERGARRLDDPDDYVRLEVGTGLERRIRVIPVLVGGASLPKGDQLPDNMKRLVRRQAVELSDTRWDYDTRRLITSIQEATKPSPDLPPAAPPRTVERPPAMASSPITPELEHPPRPAQDRPAPQPPAPRVNSTAEQPVERSAVPADGPERSPQHQTRTFGRLIGAEGPAVSRPRAFTFFLALLASAFVNQLPYAWMYGPSLMLQPSILLSVLAQTAIALAVFRYFPSPTRAIAIAIGMTALRAGLFAVLQPQLLADTRIFSTTLAVTAAHTFLFYVSLPWFVARFKPTTFVLFAAALLGDLPVQVVGAIVGPDIPPLTGLLALALGATAFAVVFALGTKRIGGQ